MIDAIGSAGTYLNTMDRNTLQRRPPRPNFNDLDTNGDSTLDQTELQTMLDKISEKNGTTIDGEKVFSVVDSNQDGAISQEEFIAGEKKVRDLIGPPPPPMKNNVDGAKKSGDYSDLILGLLNESSNANDQVNADEYTTSLMSQSYLSDYVARASSSSNTGTFPLDLMA